MFKAFIRVELMIQYRFRKIGIVAGSLLILAGLVSIISLAISGGGDEEFSSYTSSIVEITNEISVSSQKVMRAGSDIVSSGLSVDSAVNMSVSKPIASTGVPKGNWYYRAEVYVVGGKTPPNTVYRAELYRWDPALSDYMLVGTIYFRSDSSPSTGEGVRLYFDLGAGPLSSSEAFMLVIKRA